jgi:hypothetical protein
MARTLYFASAIGAGVHGIGLQRVFTRPQTDAFLAQS